MPQLPAFKAFLSHRYKSPEVNEFFFELFTHQADVVFDIDAAEGATNVTRLERMVRASDGFVGIYPFVPDPKLSVSPLREQRKQAAKYFRLEMGLAVRAMRPTLIYADNRFGTEIDPPPGATYVEFDYEEATGGGISPNRELFADRFTGFVKQVRAGMAFAASQRQAWQTDRVGVLLPDAAPYADTVLRRVADIVEEIAGQPKLLRWPRSIDSTFIGQLYECDWIITDVQACQSVGLLGLLEGRAIPLLRLLNTTAGDSQQWSTVEQTLYGAYDVGYSKDIVRWSEVADLDIALKARLIRITGEVRHLVKRQDAYEYFRSAALRKEPVFVSYAGADAERARPIIQAFQRRFQRVFDYKDGESIAAGRPWLDEIFFELNRSSLAILLLSPAYFKSGNCEHEAQAAIARNDDRQLRVLPVRLTDPLEVPLWLKELQHFRYGDTSDPNEVVQRAVDLLTPKP